MSDLYNARQSASGQPITITKFDSDLNPLASYTVTVLECSCPAGFRPMCRHREMLPTFLTSGHVDDGTFYNYDLKTWLPPLRD